MLKQAELEADDIEQLCMELDELQALEQGLNLPLKPENTNFASAKQANIIGSDSESSKLCLDSSFVQNSSDARNLKTSSVSSVSVRGTVQGTDVGTDQIVLSRLTFTSLAHCTKTSESLMITTIKTKMNIFLTMRTSTTCQTIALGTISENFNVQLLNLVLLFY